MELLSKSELLQKAEMSTPWFQKIEQQNHIIHKLQIENLELKKKLDDYEKKQTLFKARILKGEQMLKHQNESHIAAFSLWTTLSNQFSFPFDKGEARNIHPDQFEGYIQIVRGPYFPAASFWITMCTNLQGSIAAIKACFGEDTFIIAYPVLDPLFAIEYLKDLISRHEEAAMIKATLVDSHLKERPITLYQLSLHTLLEDLKIVLESSHFKIPPATKPEIPVIVIDEDLTLKTNPQIQEQCTKAAEWILEDAKKRKSDSFPTEATRQKKTSKKQVGDPPKPRVKKQSVVAPPFGLPLLNVFMASCCILDKDVVLHRVPVDLFHAKVIEWAKQKGIIISASDIYLAMTQITGLYFDPSKKHYYGVGLKDQDCRIYITS